jgi:hypothetical protein
MTELLLGCGFQRKKQARRPGDDDEWKDLVTLDHNPNCKPDLHCDLNTILWQCRALTSQGEKVLNENELLREDFFAEVHAYEVLEHLGFQGDVPSFFGTFNNLYRILVPDGLLFATCPSPRSSWLWGDPGHCRVIQKESLMFLDQSQYTFGLGKSPMSDYRNWWKGDFQAMSATDDGTTHRFVLKAIKPARI